MYSARLVARACAAAALFTSSTSASVERDNVHNANYIFNAIHSSMRQWGSSLNHNGMSFFMASVPAGTQFYHGTGQEEEVKGMQWLAFEPEHALIFARPRGWRGPPPPGGPPGGPEGPPPGKPPGGFFKKPPGPPPGLRPGEAMRKHKPSSDHPGGRPGRMKPRNQQSQTPWSQKPLLESSDPDVGYMHTYTTLHRLNLLYIDGLSAGKTSNGTLDTQDKLLLNFTSSPNDRPMLGEFERAEGLCNMSSTVWGGKIDGVLRMEGGFEVILCDFEKHLQRSDVITLRRGEDDEFPGHLMGGWQYIKAITARYHDIGGDRVVLNYEDFVTVFEYPDLEGLFENDVQSDVVMPRLQNVPGKWIERAKSDVTSMILRSHQKPGQGRNWQKIADMIVERYSTALHHLRTDKLVRKDGDALKASLMALVRPFVDLHTRNTTRETERCVAQLVPGPQEASRSLEPIAHRAVHAVMTRVCGTLIDAFSQVSSSPKQSLVLIDDLFEYLQWTTWKQCATCEDEKLCFIPIWPMGSHEDHREPRCLDEREAGESNGYWGLRRGPPHAGDE